MCLLVSRLGTPETKKHTDTFSKIQKMIRNTGLIPSLSIVEGFTRTCMDQEQDTNGRTISSDATSPSR